MKKFLPSFIMMEAAGCELPIDYNAGLGRVLFSAGKADEAARYYKTALDLALLAKDTARAVVISRSMAVLYFTIGNEESAACYSSYALTLGPGLDQTVRHLKI